VSNKVLVTAVKTGINILVLYVLYIFAFGCIPILNYTSGILSYIKNKYFKYL